MNWFVLTLPEPEAALPEGSLSWARIGNGAVLERGTAPLAEVPTAIQRGDRVLALVPGERVLLYHVAIPARSRSAQLQALPYALEERLSEDLEAMHIVPGSRLPDGGCRRRWPPVGTWTPGSSGCAWPGSTPRS
jgi:general secretion pathway protein L